jgi:HNH endonuclease
VSEDMAARIRANVSVENGCWLWNGVSSSTGYGTLRVNGPTRLAHRVSYEAFVGTIPPGYQIDHLCRVPACVNPDHLEAVTPRENIRRSGTLAAITQRTGTCQRGHEMNDAYVRPGGRKRMCRSCKQERDRTYYWRRQQVAS